MPTRLASIAAVALLLLPGSALADTVKANCKLYPKGGVIKTSYKLVGPQACLDACKSTDGCTAWSYTAHNFNPKKAPGQCRLLKEVAEEKKMGRQESCGYIGK